MDNAIGGTSIASDADIERGGGGVGEAELTTGHCIETERGTVHPVAPLLCETFLIRRSLHLVLHARLTHLHIRHECESVTYPMSRASRELAMRGVTEGIDKTRVRVEATRLQVHFCIVATVTTQRDVACQPHVRPMGEV